MTLPLQEISDRLEIEELLTRYCFAIDSRDWTTFRTLFTPDAVIDDTVTGGIKSGVEEHIPYLINALSKVSMSRHIVTAPLSVIDNNTAHCRSQCLCPMQITPDGAVQTFFLGVRYEDTLVRTPEGWRIQKRIETDFWQYNVPEGFSFQ